MFSVIAYPKAQTVIVNGESAIFDFLVPDELPENLSMLHWKDKNTGSFYRTQADEANIVLDETEENYNYWVKPFVKLWEAQYVLTLQEKLTDAVQVALDAFAKTRGYDGIMSACSYSNSTDAQFKLEADYCIQLRDTTWRMGYAILAEVKAGNRPVPTVEELIAELPVGSAKWPDEQ